jgi:hypothetical protein
MVLLLAMIFCSIALMEVNGQCTNNTCQNGGTCINCNASINYCHSSSTFFCVCKPDYCGSTCTFKRAGIAIITVQSTNTATAAYNDPTSVEYNLLATRFNYIASQIMLRYFMENSVTSAVGSTVLSFNSSVLLGQMGVSYQIRSGTMDMSSVKSASLTNAISLACVAVCSGIAVDTSNIKMELNVNVCNYIQANSCSQNASCTFLGGVNYTCTCLPGYSDDSGNSGQICTYYTTTFPPPSTTIITTTTTTTTITTTTTTQSASPDRCGNLICRNGASCQTSHCLSNAANCCKCTADYVGDQCDLKRQIIMIQTLKCSQTFTNDLLNSSSTSFINLANSFIAICRRAMEYFYNSKNITNVAFIYQVIQFSSSPVSVNMSFSAAMTTTSGSLQIPTSAEMGWALNNSCTSSTCDSIGLDRNNISTISNPNVCQISAINSCSPFATCTFYDGLNHTCSCNSGFVDESNNLLIGRICTESCSNNKCSPGDCRNKTGAQYECINCPTGYNGRFCKNDSQKVNQSQILVLICAFIYCLIIFHMEM